ncbi:MAG TPA: alpha/beta hydrolase-fold protein [Steroidobacteraceae bacterium]|nr:alpha/beta hydrolase-fold protein [Steroidobacteraceae bacterium]
MALKRSRWAEGRLVVLEHVSQVLRDNPLGDPFVRKLAVWLPPQYDQGLARGRGRRFPVLVDMVGFTGSGMSHVAWKSFSENVPERVARLVHERRMAPAILVFPDCFTALGGNQYVNSTAIGRYADYLIREILPHVDREFRTLASREHRGCFGKSSGGYGAIVHGMRYPHTWGAIADHSGDAYFDFVYWCDWPNTLSELAKYRARPQRPGRYDVRRMQRGADRGADDGRVRRFLEAVWKKPKLSGAEVHAIMNLCMAATYDADPRAPNGFRLPVNLETGERLPERWRAWMREDPINLVARHRAALRSLRGIYIDCGWRDQYHIQYGSRILSKRLAAMRIAHTYQEFDDDHSDIDYRMEVSLPFLSRALR